MLRRPVQPASQAGSIIIRAMLSQSAPAAPSRGDISEMTTATRKQDTPEMVNFRGAQYRRIFLNLQAQECKLHLYIDY